MFAKEDDQFTHCYKVLYLKGFSIHVPGETAL
jgi:hypothetical protein